MKKEIYIFDKNKVLSIKEILKLESLDFKLEDITENLADLNSMVLEEIISQSNINPYIGSFTLYDEPESGLNIKIPRNFLIAITDFKNMPSLEINDSVEVSLYEYNEFKKEEPSLNLLNIAKNTVYPLEDISGSFERGYLKCIIEIKNGYDNEYSPRVLKIPSIFFIGAKNA